MAEYDTKMCRICLTINTDDNVSDSSRYATFFTQIMRINEINGNLWLCLWCKASLRRAMSLLKMALESHQMLKDKIVTDINPKSLYKLNYSHNPHIDIPPLLEYQDDNIQQITEISDEIINPIPHNEVKIPLKRNEECLQHTDDKATNKKSYENSNCEHETLENGKVIKRKTKKEFNFNELNFEVEHLNLEEQLKEVEIKRLKYKDFKYQCIECGMGFLTSDVYDEHNLIRHSEVSGPHKCQICSLHFKSQDVLSQHMLAHKRRFKCLICKTVFKRWSHCTAHRYKCGGVVQPTACGECSKIFSNEHALKIHMKVHKTEKKFCCEVCDKKFSNKHRLAVHLRCHSGIKPFSCPRCDRSFSTSSNLRAHTAVHDHFSQFYCVECHTYYKTAKSLKRHFNESARHMTPNTDMYSCKECSKQFSTEKSLNCHVKTRHGTEYRCTDCDKTFSNNSNLNKHIKCIHTIK